MSKNGLIVLLVAFVIFLILLTPFITISAISVLLGHDIPWNVWTYLSALWLHIVFGAGAAAKASQD